MVEVGNTAWLVVYYCQDILFQLRMILCKVLILPHLSCPLIVDFSLFVLPNSFEMSTIWGILEKSVSFKVLMYVFKSLWQKYLVMMRYIQSFFISFEADSLVWADIPWHNRKVNWHNCWTKMSHKNLVSKVYTICSNNVKLY